MTHETEDSAPYANRHGIWPPGTCAGETNVRASAPQLDATPGVTGPFDRLPAAGLSQEMKDWVASTAPPQYNGFAPMGSVEILPRF